MESVLISLVREHKAEGRVVVVGAMVEFLVESFPFMTRNQATVIAAKVYEKS